MPAEAEPIIIDLSTIGAEPDFEIVKAANNDQELLATETSPQTREQDTETIDGSLTETDSKAPEASIDPWIAAFEEKAGGRPEDLKTEYEGGGFHFDGENVRNEKGEVWTNSDVDAQKDMVAQFTEGRDAYVRLPDYVERTDESEKVFVTIVYLNKETNEVNYCIKSHERFYEKEQEWQEIRGEKEKSVDATVIHNWKEIFDEIANDNREEIPEIGFEAAQVVSTEIENAESIDISKAGPNETLVPAEQAAEVRAETKVESPAAQSRPDTSSPATAEPSADTVLAAIEADMAMRQMVQDLLAVDPLDEVRDEIPVMPTAEAPASKEVVPAASAPAAESKSSIAETRAIAAARVEPRVVTMEADRITQQMVHDLLSVDSLDEVKDEVSVNSESVVNAAPAADAAVESKISISGPEVVVVARVESLIVPVAPVVEREEVEIVAVQPAQTADDVEQLTQLTSEESHMRAADDENAAEQRIETPATEVANQEDAIVFEPTGIGMQEAAAKAVAEIISLDAYRAERDRTVVSASEKTKDAAANVILEARSDVGTERAATVSHEPKVAAQEQQEPMQRQETVRPDTTERAPMAPKDARSPEEQRGAPMRRDFFERAAVSPRRIIEHTPRSTHERGEVVRVTPETRVAPSNSAARERPEFLRARGWQPSFAPASSTVPAARTNDRSTSLNGIRMRIGERRAA